MKVSDEFEGIEHIHLMGIGGAGMSALALLLVGAGFTVDGCDLSRSDYTSKIEKLGIDCIMGHSPLHIEKFSPQLVVYSSAVNSQHEELLAARKRGIRTANRGLVLSWLFNASRGIGVAGTHGKTTTSSMIGLILEHAEYDPTLAVGAEVSDIGINARVGKSDFFVAEIDESDGSFEFFKPRVTAITNADWDHVNYFLTREDVISAFIRFAKGRKPNTPLVICAEDEGTQSLIKSLGNDPELVTCGWGKSWNWGAFDVAHKAGGGVVFSVACNGETLGKIELIVSGDHNILNALVACAATSSLGIPFETITETLRGFHGARHRLEKLGKKGGVQVIDDYAHHPTEIAASISAVRDTYPGHRLVVVFQPHRYTRTAVFYREIASALEAADLALLLPIYAAGEISQKITSEAIVDTIVADGYRSIFCNDEEDALSKLNALLSSGDILVTMGAGDVSHLGEVYLNRL
ncbi:MAG: UDP-N-acetylmuramate--L-alanine ligase [Synergistaceae bacterium]|nr:UDP-N-acetylmuramate--L-alanine ligase [Synergistaceae bacterium]